MSRFVEKKYRRIQLELSSSRQQFARRLQVILDQIFKADETGLVYKLLPNQTYSVATSSSVSGRKISKEQHVTVSLRANASGAAKIAPQFVRKYKRPHAF